MPQFPSLALTMLINCLRLANRESGQAVFSWRVVSPEGGTVTASDGLEVNSESLYESTFDPGFIFVLASYRPLDPIVPRLAHWLRQQQQSGCYLAGIESGSFLLAEAGVLRDHAVALHYEDRASFRERWPEQALHDGSFRLDRRLASAAGAASTLDFALALIEQRQGPLLADQVARILLHDRRDHLGRSRPDSGADSLLQQCRELMLEHLEQPLSIPEICQRLDLQERRLRRLFKRALGVSPLQYYLGLRLTEARFMLVSGDMKVSEVGLACGFDNAASFSRAFRAHFGFPPSRRRSPYTGLLPTPFWPETGGASESGR